MKRLPWYKLFPENWFRYTSGLSREAKGDYMDATAAALMDGEAGKTVFADSILALAEEASHKQSRRARARWDAAGCHGMPRDATARGGMPEDANQRREIENREIGFQPQQAISNQPKPNQPNARANAGETGPTSPPPVEAVAVEAAGADCQPNAPHGPQDARREPQAADPSPRPSPPPSPRTEAHGAAPVGGIAGTVQTVLQSVGAGGERAQSLGAILDDDFEEARRNPMGWFMQKPKDRLGSLADNLLPSAAAAFCKSQDQNRAVAGFEKAKLYIGGVTFRNALAAFIAEDAQGENANVRDKGAVFMARLKKLAMDKTASKAEVPA